MSTHPDPRDAGDQDQKRWEEFRASYAAARLLGWLVRDLEVIAPHYVQKVSDRLYVAGLHADNLEADNPDIPREYPIPSADENSHEYDWKTEEEFQELYEQLFPHGEGPGDFEYVLNGMCVVATYSALEHYARELGVSTRRLPKKISQHLAKGNEGLALTADEYSLLLEFDATRHILVHNRGIVDGRFVDQVPENVLLIGERCPLRKDTVERFGDLAWRVAKKLKGLTT